MCTSTSNRLTIGSDLALKTHNSRRKSRTLTISSHPREVSSPHQISHGLPIPVSDRGVGRRRRTRPALSPSTREGVTRRRMLLLLLLRNTCDDDDDLDDAMLVPRHNPTTKLRFWDPPPTLLLPKQIAPSPYTQGTIYKSARVHATATATSPTESQQRNNHPKMRAPAATTDARDSPHGGRLRSLSLSLSLPPTFTDTPKPRTRASEIPRAQCRPSYERRPARKQEARP